MDAPILHGVAIYNAEDVDDGCTVCLDALRVMSPDFTTREELAEQRAEALRWAVQRNRLVLCPNHRKQLKAALDEANHRENFHKHLDVCEQCRDHPMALCQTGAQLLTRAVTRGGL